MGRIWAGARRERGFRRDGCASRLARAAAVGCALALAACAVGPDFIRPASLVEADWTTLRSRAGRPGLSLGAEAFWASFHDQTLTRLLKKADAHSPTLLGAVETVTQARRQIRIDVANLLPTVDLSGSSEYGQPTLASSLKGGNLGATTDQLLGQMSWEIDFWGSLRRALASDKDALLSSEAALQASRVSIEASVASAYVNLRMTERRIAVARDNLAKQAENKRIAEAKWREGLDSELDFRQAESQYQQTKAQLPGLQQSPGAIPLFGQRTGRRDARLVRPDRARRRRPARDPEHPADRRAARSAAPPP